MPATEWLNKYESVKDKLACKADLETYFTEKMIGNMAVDVLDHAHLPTLRFKSIRNLFNYTRKRQKFQGCRQNRYVSTSSR